MSDEPDLLDVLRGGLVEFARQDVNDLSSRQLATLLACETDTEMLTAAALATRLAIGTAAVSAVLDRLEKLRLVQRVDDVDDRRSILITVTAAGRALVQRLRAGLQAAAGG